MAKLSPPQYFHGAIVKLARGLSEFSYSLYLSHFPIVMLIGVCCYGCNRITPSFGGYFQLGVWFLLLVGIGGCLKREPT